MNHNSTENKTDALPVYLEAHCILTPGYMLAIPSDKLHRLDEFDDEIEVEDGFLKVHVVLMGYICPKKCPGCPLDIRLPIMFTDIPVFSQYCEKRIYLNSDNIKYDIYGARPTIPEYSTFLGYMDDYGLFLTRGADYHAERMPCLPDDWTVRYRRVYHYAPIEWVSTRLDSKYHFPEHDGYEEEGEC